MSSNFIQIVACGRSCFLFKDECYFILWINYVLLIHSSVDGHLDFFPVLVTGNTVAKNKCVNARSGPCYHVFGACTPECNCYLTWQFCLSNHHTLFHRSCTTLPSRQQCRRVPVVLNPHCHVFFSSFFVAILVCVKCYRVWFWFVFHYWLVMLKIFSCVHWSFTHHFWRNVYSIYLSKVGCLIYLFIGHWVVNAIVSLIFFRLFIVYV